MFVVTLCIVGMAHADDSEGIFMEGPINMPSEPDAFYCQQPVNNFYANNASSGFVSEIVDDIPTELDGSVVQAVTVYLAEWGGPDWDHVFHDPVNIVINFYDDACLPETTPEVSYVVPYASVTATELQVDPWYVVELYVPLPTPIEMGSTGSIGWYADNDWGQQEPYCGAIITDDNAIWGACGAYWAGDNWGYPRWTPLSDYYSGGVDHDLACCLWAWCTPTLNATWGKIKSLYE